MNERLTTRLYNMYYSHSYCYCYGLDYVLRLQISKQWMATSLLSDELKNEFSKLSLRDRKNRSV
jgi:hypothetical protein